jgi:hypothetical protein
MSDDRDELWKSAGTFGLIIFLLWAIVAVFALSQL